MLILLDLDGVVTDFERGVCRLCGKEDVRTADDLGKPIHEVLGISVGQLWQRVDQAGAKFWRELEPTPWADELVKLCRRHGEIVIATSPSNDPGASAGKVAWLQKRFGKRHRDFAITPRKDLLAAPGRLLIDDTAKHVDAFAAAGGSSVLVPTAANGGLTEGVSVIDTITAAIEGMTDG